MDACGSIGFDSKRGHKTKTTFSNGGFMSAIFGFGFLALTAFLAAGMHARADVHERNRRDLRKSVKRKGGW